MATLTVDSFAKLNLLLTVRKVRKDGYHSIETLFERISLKDTITLTERADSRISLTTTAKKLATDSSNLAFRSASLLKEYCGAAEKGVAIHIRKNIPIGSGMAGGSSNAAAVLLGLNKLWKLKLSRKKLAFLAARLGSDVPFFVYQRPFAMGTGRGERIKPLGGLQNLTLWHVIAVPRLSVSTPLIYQAWDRDKSLRLTRAKSSVKLIFLALKKKDIYLLSQAISNSLEPVTESLYPEVLRVKDALLTEGAKSILMSGSGPAVFCVLGSRKEAVSIFKHLQRKNRSWDVFLARSI